MSFAVDGRHVLVLGAGKTGIEVATFLHQRSAKVRLVERSRDRLAQLRLPSAIDAREEDDPRAALSKIELVIPSPGVPRSHPVLIAAQARGIPIHSEIELAFRFLRCPVVAISGTNGKSTTTTLLGEMFVAAGRRTFVGGNLGTPLITACARADLEVAIAEVSSFQLEWVATFRPRVALLLNLTPDHLDRYASLAEYQQAKAALLRMQLPEDVAVLNRDDAWVWEQRLQTRARVVSFGQDPVEYGTYIDGDELVVWGAQPPARRFSLARTSLVGTHNRQNIMAAATAAAFSGLDDSSIQRAIDETRGLPHRLELVRERNGVRYFDDSKGTNVGAVAQSLASFPDAVILLAGGYDKGGDFGSLLPLLKTRARSVVAFGAAGPLVERQLEGGCRIVRVADLAAAVRTAADEARAGDVVLLSPGCASFDEFRDYAERGERFRQLVEAL